MQVGDMQDRLDRVQDMLDYADEAINNLQCVEDCDGIIEAIRDRVRELIDERETIRGSIETMQEAELDAERRAYWRDVL